MELFRGYRNLGSVEAKGAYLDGLANDPQGGMKARSIAVQSLYRLGVVDHATLSLANRLGDADAIALAKAVLDAVPGKTRGTGAVVCTCPQPAPLRDNLFAVPVWFV